MIQSCLPRKASWRKAKMSIAKQPTKLEIRLFNRLKFTVKIGTVHQPVDTSELRHSLLRRALALSGDGDVGRHLHARGHDALRGARHHALARALRRAGPRCACAARAHERARAALAHGVPP